MPRGGAHNVKPSAQKALHGNPGKRPINLREPQPDILENLTPPSWLDATARACWRKNAPELQRLGLLTVADVNTFALYCQAFSRYRFALKSLSVLDPMSEAYRPVAVTVEKAEATLRLFATDFGMNPAARSRLSVTTEKPEVDPMETLLSGRRAG